MSEITTPPVKSPKTNEDFDIFSRHLNGQVLNVTSEWIAKNKDPQDVFTQAQLEAWAKDNGFIEENNE